MYHTPLPEDNIFDKYDEPRLHMERLLKVKLVEYDISIRILLPLETAGIITLGDLTRQSRDSLGKIRNLGKISIDRLESFLHYYNLALSVGK